VASRCFHEQVRADIAASFQRVALAHLEERVRRSTAWALESHPDIQHLVAAGGVASNQLLRTKLQACSEDTIQYCHVSCTCGADGTTSRYYLTKRAICRQRARQDAEGPEAHGQSGWVLSCRMWHAMQPLNWWFHHHGSALTME
jgi:hypothetical protein